MSTSSFFVGPWKVVAPLALVLFSAASASAQFDPAQQFSAVNNPNPPWSYGFENFPLPGPFSLLPAPVPVPSTPGPFVDSWQALALGELAVLHNGTAAMQLVTTAIDNALYQPGELAMHPGPNDQYAVVQFTAPVNGDYLIQGVFEGIDTGGSTNTDVHLLLNTVPVVGGTVIGDGPGSDVPLTFGPIALAAGDTLAFAVGGSPFQGTTALLPGAMVSAVPEPSTLALAGLGGLALLGYRYRRWAHSPAAVSSRA